MADSLRTATCSIETQLLSARPLSQNEIYVPERCSLRAMKLQCATGLQSLSAFLPVRNRFSSFYTFRVNLRQEGHVGAGGFRFKSIVAFGSAGRNCGSKVDIQRLQLWALQVWGLSLGSAPERLQAQPGVWTVHETEGCSAMRSANCRM